MNYQGRRTKKCFQQNEKLANQFAEKVLARIKWCEASGEPFPLAAKAAAPTVQAYLEEWLKTYAVHCKPSTAQGYRRWLELYIYPVLGGKRLGEVGRAEVKRLIAELSGKGLKQQTIHNILMPLKESYNHAIDDGIMTTNPVARTGRLTRSREDRRKRLIRVNARGS